MDYRTESEHQAKKYENILTSLPVVSACNEPPCWLHTTDLETEQDKEKEIEQDIKAVLNSILVQVDATSSIYVE